VQEAIMNPVANYMMQHLTAPNDVNGNPRRLYYVLNVWTGKDKVYDEGYVGFMGIPEYIRTSYFELPHMKISASEYKRFLKELGQ
jgi:hypothetical protein